MALIIETIVTTRREDGTPHIAPLGLIQEGEDWIVAPFRPSATLENLRRHPFAVANHVEDVRIFAGCLTGRRDWPVRPAARIEGAVLEAALTHWELAVKSVSGDELRPHFHCRVAYAGTHRPFAGFNRAQAAVLEAAVLTSRLNMLPRSKIMTERAYLQSAIDKTAGPREREAWGWLMEEIDAYFAEAR